MEGCGYVKAIILAAGQGTRLKKYTKNLPKGMLSFMGKTIIERQIEIYRECGITDISIVRGFAGEKINYAGIKYYTNRNYMETNMVESLMTAKSEFMDDVIISYSDIIFEKDMLVRMIECRDDFAVAVDRNWRVYWQKRYGRIDFDTESLSIDPSGNITELGLETPSLNDIDARYIGLLRFSRYGMSYLLNVWEQSYGEYLDKPWQQSGKKIRQAYMTDLLNAVIESGKSVKSVSFSNGWIEFDTNEDYENACQWVKDGSIAEILKL